MTDDRREEPDPVEPSESQEPGAVEDHAAATARRRRRAWIAVGGAVLAGFAALVATWILDTTVGSDLTKRAFAVAASFAASALWWVILLRPAEQEVRSLLREQLNLTITGAENARKADTQILLGQLKESRTAWESDVERLSSELTESRETRERQVMLLKTELMGLARRVDATPAAVYRSRDSIDLRFNRDLTRHLTRSRSYEFHGPTGVYVGARLRVGRATDRLAHVRVRISSPTSQAALHHAAHDRMQRPQHAQKDIEDVIAEIRLDIYMAIVGLFDARGCANQIEIVLDERGVSERIEHFTDAVYVASVAENSGHNFTHTLRWDRGKQHQYETNTAVSQRTWDQALGTALFFSPGSPKSELKAVLAKLNRDADASGLPTLKTLRSQYREQYVRRQERTMTHVERYFDDIPHP